MNRSGSFAITDMRLGYFGSPPISARLLEAILKSTDHTVACVVSNPDRPRGRSGTFIPTEVAQLALERDIPLFRFEKLKAENAAAQLAEFKVDLFVVFAYGRLLPEAVFQLPPLGSINLHASLLPHLRGAAPIQMALYNGDPETGWSVQYVATELDSGDVLARAALKINPHETAGELTERMLPGGIDLMLDTLDHFSERAATATPQDPAQVTTCPKLTMEMSPIDWNNPAGIIHNRVRALNPWPVARTRFSGEKSIKVYRTAPVLESDQDNALPLAAPADAPGDFTVSRSGSQKRLFVRCGDARLLEILELQPENRKKLTSGEFLNGYQKDSGRFE